MIKPRVVLGGLVSEAWARSVGSYSRSMEYYNVRVKDGSQPYIPFINVFDVNKNTVLLCAMNSLYLIITFGIFWYMKRRQKGFQLRWLLVAYDALNVVLAAYIAISTLKYKLGHGGLLLCNPIATDAEGYNIARVFVLFYFQKYLEFFDTWFFLLRKSSRQVTFLHLFHHSSITVVVGSILPFDYNGDMYLPIMLNSANHMLVYLHYLLATLGLKSWWASYITSLQLSQFCIIFAQSLLSYRVGPTCGSPDFAKVLMILYMGSMVALFGNFFLQRYVLRRPYTGLDMCGVIKSPPAGPIASTQLCGVAKLNAHGCCVVLLPPEFPDPDTARVGSSLRSSGACLYAPFTVAYHLTPLGAAMPQLHISTEVTRFSTSVWKSMGVTSAKIEEKEPAETAKSGGKAAAGSAALVPASKKKNAAAHFSNQTTEQNLVEQEQEIEQHILRNYWATNTKSFRNGFSRGSSQGKMPRSVSTGNIPSFYSSPLRNAKSAGNFLNMHNDRLIDGPLPLLGRLGGLSTAAICQLGRDESDTENEYDVPSPKSRSGKENGKNLPSAALNGAGPVSDSALHVPNGSQEAKSTHSPSNPRNSSSKGGIIPLCFTISGGVPLGRISWMVTSLPQEANTSGGLSGTDAYTDSEGAIVDAGGTILGAKDWRAL